VFLQGSLLLINRAKLLLVYSNKASKLEGSALYSRALPLSAYIYKLYKNLIKLFDLFKII
jgi:hypothetical protein